MRWHWRKLREHDLDRELRAHLELEAAEQRNDEKQITAALQNQIRSLDSSVPAGHVQTIDEQLSRVLAYPRFRGVVLERCGARAVTRKRGFVRRSPAVNRAANPGIRRPYGAGADRRDVLRLVIRHGIVLTRVGLAPGLIAAFGLRRWLTRLLYGVRAIDPWIWSGVSRVLLLVALLATCVPAWRAARVDPVTALRYE